MVSIGLFSYGAWQNHSLDFSYLIWNLILAWLPLLIAIRLIKVLKLKIWSSWEALLLFLLWLVLLPNSFYMISDFIHLQEVQRVDILYDTLMFTSFIYTGVALGFSSLYLLHMRVRNQINPTIAGIGVAVTLFICSGAVYIGRDLRWNSWDILTNPGGLLFDVSDRLEHPSSYPEMITTVISFFIILLSMYGLLWRGTQLVKSMPKNF